MQVSSVDEVMGASVPCHQGVRVRTVARLGRPLSLNVQGGPGSDLGGGADAVAMAPLVFLLDATPFVSDGSFSAVGSAARLDADDPVDVEALLSQLN